MNVTTNQKPILEYTGFKGLYTRGAYETCPKDHLQDCHNCSFPGPGQVTIREPVTASTIVGGRAFQSYFVATLLSGPRLLTLDTSGVFRDETVGPTTLATISGTAGVIPDDFAAINIFTRTYISFKYQGKALPGGFTYYYDGTNFLKIAGIAPSTSPTLAQANVGIVDIGVHGVAVSFQTSTGYLSPPCTIANISSTGVNDIELSAIPTGPTGTVARVILMTQANGVTLFFVPGGTINDNTTTTGTINVHDTALISSAAYLNNILPTVPSCSAIRFYNGRLVLIGLDVQTITTLNGNVQTIPDNIFLSNQLSPETLDSVNNIISFPTDYGINTSSSGLVINSVLYILKPNGTYSTQDNGSNPGTWGVNVIDTALGAWDNGTTLFASSMAGADVSGTSFVATRKGIMLFNGTYSTVPLSYKIQSLWNLILSQYFYYVQCAHDVWNKRLYVAVPLIPPNNIINGTATTVNTATTGKVVTYTAGLSLFPGMVGMYVQIGGVPYLVSTVNFPANWSATTAYVVGNLVTIAGVTYVCTTNNINQLPPNGTYWAITTHLQNLIVTTDPGNHTGTNLSCEYPGGVFQSGAAGTYVILMMDYNDGLDPMSVKWSTWTSDIFSSVLGSNTISKMSVENFTGSYVGTTQAIYQLSFCNGGNTIYKIITFPSGLNQVITQPTPQDVGGHSCLQYLTVPAGGDDTGVYMFTLVKFSIYANGKLYPSIVSKNRSTQTFLASFNISSYSTSQDFDRLINQVNESMSVIMQNDLSNPNSNNGFLQPTSVTVFGKKMWQMRAALTQSS